MTDEYLPPDGVQPENDLEDEEEIDSHTLRFQAILLLLAILLPLVLAAIEYLTGGVSRVIQQVIPFTGKIGTF